MVVMRTSVLFTHFRTGNDVTAWRGVKKFNRKPQLVGGGNFGPIFQRSAFKTVQFLQSILDIKTNINTSKLSINLKVFILKYIFYKQTDEKI